MPKKIKLPNKYGTVTKLSGKHRRPYHVQVTTGWKYDAVKDRMLQVRVTLGYTKTYAQGIVMLDEYHKRPIDLEELKTTFKEVYERYYDEYLTTKRRYQKA